MAYKKITGIYKITSPTNKVYIGKSKNLNQRKNNYKSSLEKIKSQVRLYNSIVKYGWETHIFEIIEECAVEDLYCRERFWQDEFDVLGKNGLNCILQECKEHPAEISDDTRRKMSEASKGEKNPMFGKDWRIGKTKEELEQHRSKIINYLTKEFIYEEGSWDNVKSRKLNRKSTSKKVINTRTQIIFNSLKEASEYYSINYKTLKSRMFINYKHKHELQYLESTEYFNNNVSIKQIGTLNFNK